MRQIAAGGNALIGIEGVTVNTDTGPYFSDPFKSEGEEAIITVDLTHLNGTPTVTFVLQHKTPTGAYSDVISMTLTSTGPASVYASGIKPLCRYKTSLAGASFDSATLMIGSVGWFPGRLTPASDSCEDAGCDCPECSGELSDEDINGLAWGNLIASNAANAFWSAALVADQVDNRNGLREWLFGVAATHAGRVAGPVAESVLTPPPWPEENNPNNIMCCVKRFDYPKDVYYTADDDGEGNITVQIQFTVFAEYKDTGTEKGNDGKTRSCKCECCKFQQNVNQQFRNEDGRGDGYWMAHSSERSKPVQDCIVFKKNDQGAATAWRFTHKRPRGDDYENAEGDPKIWCYGDPDAEWPKGPKAPKGPPGQVFKKCEFEMVDTASFTLKKGGKMKTDTKMTYEGIIWDKCLKEQRRKKKFELTASGKGTDVDVTADGFEETFGEGKPKSTDGPTAEQSTPREMKARHSALRRKARAQRAKTHK